MEKNKSLLNSQLNTNLLTNYLVYIEILYFTLAWPYLEISALELIAVSAVYLLVFILVFLKSVYDNPLGFCYINVSSIITYFEH